MTWTADQRLQADATDAQIWERIEHLALAALSHEVWLGSFGSGTRPLHTNAIVAAVREFSAARAAQVQP